MIDLSIENNVYAVPFLLIIMKLTKPSAIILFFEYVLYFFFFNPSMDAKSFSAGSLSSMP